MKSHLNQNKKTRSRIPFLSISLAALSFFVFQFNDLTELFQYDRLAIGHGELWRCMTAHFTHWSYDHFFWCATTFVVLAIVCEQLNRKAFITSILASSLTIPLANWFIETDMFFYRGLSGICSSLFMVAAILIIQKALAARHRKAIILPTIGIILFFAKIVYEFFTGQTIFVHSNDIFYAVPLAHLVGGITGLATVSFVQSQARDDSSKQSAAITVSSPPANQQRHF